jgi:hypothetical protein
MQNSSLESEVRTRQVEGVEKFCSVPLTLEKILSQSERAGY